VLDLNFDPPQLPGIRVASQHHSSINQKLGGKAWLHSSNSNSVSGHTAVATVGSSNWSKHEAGNASNALYHEHGAATETHFKGARHIFDIRVIDASPSSAFDNLALIKKKPQSAFSRHSLPSIGSRDSFEGSFGFASDELASQRFSMLFSSQPYSSQHQVSSNSGKSKSSAACTTNDQEEEEDEEDPNRGTHKPFIQSNLRHSVSFDCADDHNEEEEERVIYESDAGNEDFQRSNSRKFLKSPHPSALPPKKPTVSSAKRRVSARQGRYNNRVASRSLDPNDFSSNSQSNIRSNKITLDPLPQRPQMLQMQGPLSAAAAVNINPSDIGATMTVSFHPQRSNQDNHRVTSTSKPPLSAKKRTVTSQRLSMDLTSNTSFTQ
jgi:hypothetical protein